MLSYFTSFGEGPSSSLSLPRAGGGWGEAAGRPCEPAEKDLAELLTTKAGVVGSLHIS